MTDRAVRTSLLRSLKSLLTVIESTYVSKHIFDPMLAGFADSNAAMREDTLKNLVHVVDKLEGKVMQDKLVRSIVNLQNDAEASLRTNATIFLGKIALKLEEAARNRIVYPAFIKAMKDQFVHCRIAGIKSTVVCLHSIDLGFLLNKMLPQICLLTVDPNSDVREIAIGVLRDSAELLQENHARMKVTEKGNREKHAANASNSAKDNRAQGNNTPPSPVPSSSSTAPSAPSGASAWIQSLVVPDSTPTEAAATQIGELNSKPRSSNGTGLGLSLPSKTTAAAPQNNDGWDDDDLDIKDDDDDIYVKPVSTNGLSKAMQQSKVSAKQTNSWDEFDEFQAGFGGKPMKETSAGAPKVKAVVEPSPLKKPIKKPSVDMTTTESVKSVGLSLGGSRSGEKEKKGTGSLKIKGAKMVSKDSDWDDF